MNCRDAHARLYRYLDGEMTPWRRVQMVWHFRQCPPCGDGAEFERKLRVRIASGCADTFPQELHDRIVAFLRQNETDGQEA